MGITRVASALLGVALTAPAPAAGPSSGPPDRAAVPLHTPPLTTPVEAAATGIAPEVTVRVRIDASGRVAQVDMVKIEPSTALDADFERVTRETLESWRYDPARKNGVPVEVQLEWTIQFAELGEREERDRTFQWRLLSRGELDAQSFRRRILTLPLDVRARMLEELAEKAKKHLVSKKISRFSSPRILVYTDAPDKEVGQAVAQNIEATFNVLEEILRPWVAPQPEPYKVVVFLFQSRSSFEALKRETRGIEWSAGFYNPLGLIALHREMPTSEALMSLLFHEATHAFVDRYVSRPGVLLPRWLDEGFADYIGASSIKKKQLVPGKTRRREIQRGPWGMAMTESRGQISIDGVKQAIKTGNALGLEEIVTASVQEFYGEKHEMYYAMSWLFVHFLRHGDPSWTEERFPELVLYAAEGYPPLEALRQTYGEPAELEERFHGYVKKF
jgi:protein TonB